MPGAQTGCPAPESAPAAGPIRSRGPVFGGATRTRRRLLIALLACIPAALSATIGATTASWSTAVNHRPPPDYARLPGAKALATIPDQATAVPGISHAQASALEAALDALNRCRVANARSQACEILWLNDERVTTGAEIRARRPDAPHPLFLWRYQNNDSVLYLAGSIHILKSSLYPLPDPIEAAFRQSDHLVVEIDVGRHTPAALQNLTQQYGLLPDSQTLADVLPPGLLRRLDRHLASYAMDATMVASARPALITNQLVVTRLMALGYDPQQGMENHFLARRAGRQVIELESVEMQLQLLFEQPMATQVELLRETLALDHLMEPLLVEMLAAWLAGDDAAFTDSLKSQRGANPLLEAFERALLDDRNLTMAGRLEDLLGTPGRYFVLVGAGHLVGESGIIALLAERGIEGRRIKSGDRL